MTEKPYTEVAEDLKAAERSAAAMEHARTVGAAMIMMERLANRIAEIAIEKLPPPMFVYMAGPIMDCTFGEANDWREYVAVELKKHNIIGISPLRCEPIHGERYDSTYPDPRFGVPRAIFAKNKFDVRRCEITLALLPKPKPGGYPSVGTLEEVGWADEAGKMIIQVTDDPRIINHPVMDGTRGWRMVTEGNKYGLPFDTIKDALDGAIATIVGVLGGYTGGKNV